MKISELTDVKAIRNYLNRIGAEARSIRTAVVKEYHGKYWKDITVIKFEKDGTVDCSSIAHLPTEVEQQAIISEVAGCEWPQLKPLKKIKAPPKMIKEADKDSIFEFRNLQNEIVMVQVRLEIDGDKRYVPWTFWDDDEWRACEPEGSLPLYNLDRIKDMTTVFIHEGAKAARHCQWMVDGETREAREALERHPWGDELRYAAHLGWIGGALSPYRTDWQVLSRLGINRVYIVSDNDAPGVAAVPSISIHLRVKTFTIQFTDEFPASFDLGDEFPEKMFGQVGEHRYYVGPDFRECLHPATWATDQIPSATGRGRPTHRLRDSFKDMWAYVEDADIFVCREMPEIIRVEQVLNKMLAPFSHVQNTAPLIAKAYSGRKTLLCYRPDVRGFLVTADGTAAINLHIPTTIKSVPGDVTPWIEFLDYLFVNDDEREEVKRWCATLIARLNVHMSYGLLLISESQGVGKTTLGECILGPLVGVHNVSFPSEHNVISPFNGWVAQKRLAVVNEIYSGHSWKAYNMLKNIITDKAITVNQKYQREYTIQNWCHVIASSNSMRALRMESDDRRWFYPEVTENKWPPEKFAEFRCWLDSGGLSIIKHWAEQFGNYVTPQAPAPMTERKKDMIEGSRSEAESEAAAAAEALLELEKPAGLTLKDVIYWVRSRAQGRVFDSDYELRKAMMSVGAFCHPERIKINGYTQYVIMNRQLYDLTRRETGKSAKRNIIRENLVKVQDILEGSM